MNAFLPIAINAFPYARGLIHAHKTGCSPFNAGSGRVSRSPLFYAHPSPHDPPSRI